MANRIEQLLSPVRVPKMTVTRVVSVDLANRLVRLEIKAAGHYGYVVAPLPSGLSNMAAGDTVWCLNMDTHLYPVTFNRPGTVVSTDDQLDELREKVADLTARLARLEA
jgi:hypothetical protein